MNSPSGSGPTKTAQTPSPARETPLSKGSSYDDHIIRHLKEITRIGAALSAEKNIEKLLEMIVDEAKSLSNADGATL